MVMFTNLANELGPHPVGLVFFFILPWDTFWSFSPTPKSARVPGALIQTSTKTAKDFGSTWRVTTSRLLATKNRCHEIVGDKPRRYHNRNVFFVWLVVSKIFYIFFISYTVWDVILLIDELIFFRGVGQPPTRQCIYIYTYYPHFLWIFPLILCFCWWFLFWKSHYFDGRL